MSRYAIPGSSLRPPLTGSPPSCALAKPQAFYKCHGTLFSRPLSLAIYQFIVLFSKFRRFGSSSFPRCALRVRKTFDQTWGTALTHTPSDTSVGLTQSILPSGLSCQRILLLFSLVYTSTPPRSPSPRSPSPRSPPPFAPTSTSRVPIPLSIASSFAARAAYKVPTALFSSLLLISVATLFSLQGALMPWDAQAAVR